MFEYYSNLNQIDEYIRLSLSVDPYKMRKRGQASMDETKNAQRRHLVTRSSTSPVQSETKRKSSMSVSDSLLPKPSKSSKSKFKENTSHATPTLDIKKSFKGETLNYHISLIAWDLDAQDPPSVLHDMNLKENCIVYAFQLTNCRNVQDFEVIVRKIIGNRKEYTSYIKTMGKSPRLSCLLIFVSTSLILERNWQCLDGSVKSKKWSVRRGSKNLFGSRSSDNGALSMAFCFKKATNIAFVGLNLPTYDGTDSEADNKRDHDVNRILNKLPFELVRRRRDTPDKKYRDEYDGFNGKKSKVKSRKSTLARNSSGLSSGTGFSCNSSGRSSALSGSSGSGGGSIKKKKVKNENLFIDHVRELSRQFLNVSQ